MALAPVLTPVFRCPCGADVYDKNLGAVLERYAAIRCKSCGHWLFVDAGEEDGGATE